ncbi:chloride-dependent neutral and basic amino acid transporter B [Seminavis robusta]|uniref:Chloride-dependent neutral and basic amino acid transporter B n=1 Tax=Seminavis robusta TaxID=568900 RepID=A0A9N8DFC4_9STRA|nr:chloride-dependent neutral and basic amino acid transporter B [Seminavis robusta]|eukprot:Sro123_g059420.1 chloride-dependent neutral and basic amino acid transporter B (661) ;mRNA; r:12102-14166
MTELKREQWSSRLAFYFAAIGAAVGFGNVWRFPALSVTYGGGAFFIPYLLALFFIGIPILILEIGFGQFFQTGDVNVFGGFHPRMRGVGVASVAAGFMLVVYYSMLIAWVVHAFFDSFGSDDPWGHPDTNGTVAVEYFVGEIIGAKTLGDDGRPTRMVWANVGCAALVWTMCFLGTAFGVQWVGRITYFTMGLPIVLLFVFLIRGLTLEGYQDGIKEYIGVWDLSVLTEQGDVWSTAVSQIFFSIGVTFGIMTAFGSYCPRGDPVTINAFVIALSNSMFSFISGFAVFAALGHLSHTSGIPVTELPYAGFSLVFGTWPVVLGTLPGGEHWVRLLFFDLFLLGIDSAFAFNEAISTVILDTKFFQGTAKWKVHFGISFCGFLLSLMYATDAGLNFLDIIDFYINFVMLIVGFFECFAAGWVYGIEKTVAKCGAPAVGAYMTANFAGLFIACGIWFGVDEGAVWKGIIALLVWYNVFLGISVVLLQNFIKSSGEELSLSEGLWALTFENIFDLKERIRPVTQNIPGIWCILIKQFIPHILIILFINLAQSETDEGLPIFGNYGGYADKPYQVMGILTFVVVVFCFTLGFVLPQAYAPLALPPGHFALTPDGAGDEQPAEQEQPVKEVEEVEDTLNVEETKGEKLSEDNLSENDGQQGPTIEA